MRKHVHGDPVQLLESGAVIYTADVSILRGPVEDGATWLTDPCRVDVCTVALQRIPRCDSQSQYHSAKTELGKRLLSPNHLLYRQHRC